MPDRATSARSGTRTRVERADQLHRRPQRQRRRPDHAELAGDVFAPNGTSCGSSTAAHHAGIYVDVNPASCVNDFGNRSGWRVTVSYQDRGTSNPHNYAYTLDGTRPATSRAR